MTSSLQKLSYKFGYSNGKSIFYNYNNIDALLRFLEASGFKSVLYYPYGDKNIIRCKPSFEKIVKNHGLKLHLQLPCLCIRVLLMRLPNRLPLPTFQVLNFYSI